jgi:hypothetical protein
MNIYKKKITQKKVYNNWDSNPLHSIKQLSIAHQTDFNYNICSI